MAEEGRAGVPGAEEGKGRAFFPGATFDGGCLAEAGGPCTYECHQ